MNSTANQTLGRRPKKKTQTVVDLNVIKLNRERMRTRNMRCEALNTELTTHIDTLRTALKLLEAHASGGHRRAQATRQIDRGDALAGGARAAMDVSSAQDERQQKRVALAAFLRKSGIQDTNSVALILEGSDIDVALLKAMDVIDVMEIPGLSHGVKLRLKYLLKHTWEE
jgi:hypothetical protein